MLNVDKVQQLCRTGIPLAGLGCMYVLVLGSFMGIGFFAIFSADHENPGTFHLLLARSLSVLSSTSRGISKNVIPIRVRLHWLILIERMGIHVPTCAHTHKHTRTYARTHAHTTHLRTHVQAQVHTYARQTI